MMFFKNTPKLVIFVIALNTAIAFGELYYGAYKEALIDFSLIAALLMLIVTLNMITYQKDLNNLLFKITDSQNACIVELAYQLAKHMPLPDVLAIIEKHGVSIQKPYDDFNNKWPPSLEEIKTKLGLDAEVAHDAREDALDVIKVLRRAYGD